MDTETQGSPGRSSRRTVRRLTAWLAALAALATAAFVGAAASGSRHSSGDGGGAAGDATQVVLAESDGEDSWEGDDDGYALSPPGLSLAPARQLPYGTTGGS